MIRIPLLLKTEVVNRSGFVYYFITLIHLTSSIYSLWTYFPPRPLQFFLWPRIPSGRFVAPCLLAILALTCQKIAYYTACFVELARLVIPLNGPKFSLNVRIVVVRILRKAVWNDIGAWPMKCLFSSSLPVLLLLQFCYRVRPCILNFGLR